MAHKCFQSLVPKQNESFCVEAEFICILDDLKVGGENVYKFGPLLEDVSLPPLFFMRHKNVP